MTYEPMPVPRRIETRNGDVWLSALEWPGAEPTIVILPGITSPAATWTFVIDAWRPANRVVVLDNRGRGLSDAPVSGYSHNDYAADLACWLRSLKLERPILLGHSMGARVLARFDIYLPGRARLLILVEPPLTGPQCAPYPIPVDFYLAGIEKARAGMTLDELRLEQPDWSDERLRDRLEWLPTCSPVAVSESYRGFHEEDFFADWEKISSPAALVYGLDSPVVTQDQLEPYHRARPDIRLCPVAGAKHMIPWENLTEFLRAISDLTHERSQERT